MKKVTFNNKNNSFFETLNAEVRGYFAEKKIKQTGDFRLYLKSLILIPGAVGIYIALLTVNMPVPIALLLCGVLGMSLASIGFNVMHDSCHGSYSENKNVNYIMGMTMNALGANAFIWKIKHNIVHHTYTNIDGVDDDIAKSPVLRHCFSQTYKPVHKYQHIYMFPLYAISSMLWALYTDFEKYFKSKIHNTSINNIPVKEHIIFWVSKVLYIVFYMAIPIYFVGFGPFLLGYFTASAVLGLTLALVFQLAHVVEITEFVNRTESNSEKLSLEDSWAAHQVRTTANFAMNSKAVSWFVGGLNFQVEHHLFPRVSHVHYPALSPIVERVCKQYGLPYNYIPSMGSAIASHFRTMKRFGQIEEEIELRMAS